MLLIRSPRVSSTIFASSKTKYTSTYDYFFDDMGDDWDDGTIIIVGGGAGLIYDLVLGAVQVFADVAARVANIEMVNGFGVSLAIRFFLGLALMGSFSFLSLLLSLSLFAPLQLANGLRGGFFRNFRRQGGTNQLGTGQLMIIAFVLIGAANSMRQTYKMTQGLTRRMLMYVETQILEVNPEERRQARERDREEHWFKRWIRFRRWKTRDGWKEMYLRTRVSVRVWYDAMRERVMERVRGFAEEEVHEQPEVVVE